MALHAVAGLVATSKPIPSPLAPPSGVPAGLRALPDRFALRYIYNERTPFEKLPDDYFCPVCGARKRRFRAYQPAVAKNANSTDVRKARKAQMKKDETLGQALPIAVVVGVVALAGLYFYLNTVY